jgi:CRP/FNR family transcriptional regulator, cyclic AMP receptor protein
MQAARLRILQEIPIFGGIDADSLAYLVDHAEHVRLGEGETLFEEGDLDNSVYVLEQGRVAIYRSYQGRQYKLRELAEGDCLGEMALLDCKPRSASVRALEPCSAIRISVAQMGQLYAAYPEQHALIYMNLAREVCRRLRQADQRLFINEAESGDEASGNAGHA